MPGAGLDRATIGPCRRGRRPAARAQRPVRPPCAAAGRCSVGRAALAAVAVAGSARRRRLAGGGSRRRDRRPRKWRPFTARWAIEAERQPGSAARPRRSSGSCRRPAPSALLDLHWQPLVDGLDLTLGGGRYLAGDWGIEAGLTRRFAGGVSVSAAAGWSFGRAPDVAGPGRDPAGVIGLRLGIPLQTLAPPTLRDRLSVSQGGRPRPPHPRRRPAARGAAGPLPT